MQHPNAALLMGISNLELESQGVGREHFCGRVGYIHKKALSSDGCNSRIKKEQQTKEDFVARHKILL